LAQENIDGEITMKITRRHLRKLINESIKGFKDPTDDPRFSDPSYSGGPGSYTLMSDDDGRRQIGISIEFSFYDSSHPLYVGDIEFYNYGVDSVDELSEEQYREIESQAMEIVSHPASRLEDNEKYEASQEFIDAMRGDENSTGTYFYPVFDESSDYDGPEDYDDDPYSYMGNFGPDMFSR
jgi:hypothetical protein